MKNIILLFGGQSGEHEVSCVSAAHVEQTIHAAGYTCLPIYIDRSGVWHLQKFVNKIAPENIKNPCTLIRVQDQFLLKSIRTSAEAVSFETLTVDFAFPIVHGTAGEDGALQGFFETIGLPYAGAGVATSAVCMDKAMMRSLFQSALLPQVKYFVIDESQSLEQIELQIQKQLCYPVFIKPCNMGSSVGVCKVKSPADLQSAVETARRFDDHLLCEEGHRVRELEVAIAGNYPDYIFSGVGEIKVKHEFYSYDAKYVDPQGAELLLKAEISEAMQSEILELARRAFRAVRGDGFARIDFFLSLDDGKIYLNEINTLPGFTPVSMFPQLMAEAGFSGPELTRRLIEWGFTRFKKISALRQTPYS